MKDNQFWSVIIVVCCVFSLLLLVFSFARSVPEPLKPEILIIRKETVAGWNDQPVLLLDYMVGGITTNASYQPYEMDLYRETIAHLKRSGRLRYASPMIEPMGGE